MFVCIWDNVCTIWFMIRVNFKIRFPYEGTSLVVFTRLFCGPLICKKALHFSFPHKKHRC